MYSDVNDNSGATTLPANNPIMKATERGRINIYNLTIYNVQFIYDFQLNKHALFVIDENSTLTKSYINNVGSTNYLISSKLLFVFTENYHELPENFQK